MKTAPVLDPLRRFTTTPLIPLVHTGIEVRIRGGLAVVATERLYRNDEPSSIEATLTFPVPVHATLVRLTARIDGRDLVAIAMDRSAARDSYEDAIDRGKTTVLHEEILRGVHQLSVGHVPPGGEIAVRSTWTSALSRQATGASLRIPTTVGDLYGRSPLAESDDLVHGPALHKAELTVDCDHGTVQFAGRVLTGGVQVTLDRPIDLIMTDWQPRTVQGWLADGRAMDVSVTPGRLSTRALHAVILVDRSGSMEEACVAGADRMPRTKHQVLVSGLEAVAAESLTKADRLQLWEFSSAPRRVGSGRGDQFAKLIGKLTPPGEGTDIGLALGAASHDSKASDFLLITDGKSYALDVQALARTGKRFHVVLIGEDSLEANVGHLAALTGGQIFVVNADDAGSTIQTALAGMRSVEVAHPAQTDELLAFRAGMRIEARQAGGPSGNGEEARLIGGFVAAMQLPAMEAAEGARFAAANGIACHLTSLVLVDEAGATQTTLPGTRKIPLSTPGMASQPVCFLAAPDAALASNRSHTLCVARLRRAYPEAGVTSEAADLSIRSDLLRPTGLPGSANRDLRRWVERIDWETDPDALRRGDLSGLDGDLVRAIEIAAQTDEVRELAAELNVPESVIVLALLAATLPTNRAARRFARAVLKGVTAGRVTATLAGLDLA